MGFIVLVIDITKQKKLEEELRQREKEIRLIADSIPASISYIDKEERYRFANKTSIEWNGRGEGLIGMTVEENLGVVYRDVASHVKRCLTGEHVFYDLSYTHNNLEKDARIHYIPDISDSQDVRGFVCLIIDITEDKQKEKDLKKKNEELLKINNDLDNFIYTASHDLKAPVSNIEGLVYDLSESLHQQFKLNEDSEQIIALIKDSILRFQSTIRDLTEISKVQRNVQEDVEAINLNSIIHEIKWSLNSIITEHGAILHTEIKEDLLVKFSKVNLRSVLQNLISNAIKYRSPDRLPVVGVKAEIVNNQLILEVSDNGLGIKESSQDKIFQMFKRLHDHVEGTGIGLYIVKRIVENANGTIELQSTEDEGSLFRIILPLSK